MSTTLTWDTANVAWDNNSFTITEVFAPPLNLFFCF